MMRKLAKIIGKVEFVLGCIAVVWAFVAPLPIVLNLVQFITRRTVETDWNGILNSIRWGLAAITSGALLVMAVDVANALAPTPEARAKRDS